MVTLMHRARTWICASCRADRDGGRRSCARCGGDVWVSPAPDEAAAARMAPQVVV